MRIKIKLELKDNFLVDIMKWDKNKIMYPTHSG